jgi:hypothetical protein
LKLPESRYAEASFISAFIVNSVDNGKGKAKGSIMNYSKNKRK